jgi:hypothetical protein
MKKNFIETFIIIINEKLVYEIKSGSRESAIVIALHQFGKYWRDVWDEKMKATSEIKGMMLSDDEILREGEIKTIKIYDKP